MINYIISILARRSTLTFLSGGAFFSILSVFDYMEQYLWLNFWKILKQMNQTNHVHWEFIFVPLKEAGGIVSALQYWARLPL